MVTQSRDVMERHEEADGQVEEIVIDGAAHPPQIEQPEPVLAALAGILDWM